VISHNVDEIYLHETMLRRSGVIQNLQGVLKRQEFDALESNGRSEGLITRCNKRR
jgi:hypothetical protein